ESLYRQHGVRLDCTREAIGDINSQPHKGCFPTSSADERYVHPHSATTPELTRLIEAHAQSAARPSSEAPGSSAPTPAATPSKAPEIGWTDKATGAPIPMWDFWLNDPTFPKTYRLGMRDIKENTDLQPL